MQTFHLFRLPFVALTNVVRQMELMEQIDLSLCSKKSKLVISSVFYVKDTFTVQLILEVSPKIQIETFSGRIDLNESMMSSKYYFLTTRLETDTSTGCVKLTKVWSDHLCKVFNSKIEDVYISTVHFSRELVEWIGQTLLEECILEGPELERTNFEFFLTNIRVRQRLCIRVPMNETVTFDGVLNQKLVYVRHAEFLNLRNVLTMGDAEKIELVHSNWNNNDLKEFFSLWLRSPKTYRSLNYFTIQIRNADPSNILSDIKFVEADSAVQHTYKRVTGTEHQVSGGYEITRVDGVKAILNFTDADEGFVIPTKKLTMIVKL